MRRPAQKFVTYLIYLKNINSLCDYVQTSDIQAIDIK